MGDVCCQLGVFSKEEFDLHRIETKILFENFALGKLEIDDGYKFTFKVDAELIKRLSRWTEMEKKCCPWANFNLADVNGILVLTVTGGGEEGKVVFSEGLSRLVEGRK